MTIVNLTQHELTFTDVAGKIFVVKPSGVIARCSQREENLGTIDVVNGDGQAATLDLTRTVLGEVTDLPDPQDGIMYCVSRLVALAVPSRQDILVPGPLLRDDQGRVIGARGVALV